ncbi:MAG TPA: PQQ-binding-like beta-propeller repeat protein [Longimicrobiales bacterium]
MTTWNAVLSRREILKLGALAAVTPRGLLASAASGRPWSFAVFSDTHFGIPGNFEKDRALLEEIAALHPDFAVDIGDLTERAWASDYDEAARAFAGLPFHVHVAPGNHDVRWAPRGLQLFGERVGPPHRLLRHRGCGFLLLDSTVPLSHWGHIGGPQLRWIDEQLRHFGREAPLFVFLHHPAGRAGGVDDQDRLGELLAPYNTKVVFTGHGHADLLWDWNGAIATMGLGLYQGSYQHVVVDPDAGEVRILRRPHQGGALVPLASAPLAPRPRPFVAAAPPPEPTSPVLQPVWRQSLGAGVMSRLLLEGEDLFVSDMGGGVSAFAAADGRPRWRFRTGGYCFSSPVAAGDRIVVGSADGVVYALDRQDGRLRWKVKTGGPVYASAAIARGSAAIASGDGTVYGIGLDDGKVRWRWALPPGPSAFAQSPAATDGKRIFIGAWDTFVYALDAATGAEAWRYRATDRGFYYSAAIGRPTVHEGQLYVPSNDNTLHAIDTATGIPVWTHRVAGERLGYSSPTLVGGRIYIGSLGGDVRCIAADSGQTIWSTSTGSEIYESSPAVSGDVLLIGSVDGKLWLLRTGDGAILGSWRFPPGLFVSTPAAAPGRAYAATFAESVVAFDVRTSA